MKLRINNNGGNRLINNGSGEKKGFRLSAKMKSKLYNSPLRETERAFNSMPKHLGNITKMTTDTFKRHLDKWLLKIPDQPKCRGYARLVSSKSNTLYDQVQWGPLNIARRHFISPVKHPLYRNICNITTTFIT